MSPAIHQAPHADLGVVLVVEDHDDSREMYSFALTHFGYHVEDAATITEAMRRIAQRPPDVIVTDLRLPGGDGLQFCRFLKASPATKDVPIIAVTGVADTLTERSARDAGCAAVLVKPCLPAELRQEIARVLDASRAARCSAASAVQRAQGLTGKSATRQARSERLLEEINQRLRSLIRRRLND